MTENAVMTRLPGARAALGVTLCGAVLAAAGLLRSGPALAADDRLTMPIDKALASDAARERIDPKIPLSFGFDKPQGAQEAHLVKVVKRMRRPVDREARKSDEEMCSTLFAQALQEFQQTASREGRNAVVQIRSNWKDDETASETTYVCAKGVVYMGVALKAVLVKVPG